MRNAKLWSVLLAAVLLCACVVGVMFTSASADGAEIYGVNYTEGIDAAKQFTSIEEVFAHVEAIVAAGNWPAGKSLEIRFTGTLTAKKGTSELLFGQKTIFTATDTKLP
ncbi:MAG: hypothetical protein IKD18_01545, partial [Clostridia bacterium]|nr:hypothetical protein [Clostridia bacterium]